MTRRGPIIVLVAAALLSLLSVLAVSRLRPESGLDGMLDPHDPATAAMGHVLADFPLAEELVVMVSLPPGDADAAKLTAFADRFDAATKADAPELVRAVQWKPSPDMRRFVEQVMAPAGLLYLSDSQLAAAKARLTPAGMREQFARDAAMLAAPGPAAGGLAKAVLNDPLRLHELLLDSMSSAGLPPMAAGGEGFFSAGGRDLLIRVEGAKPPGDLTFSAELTERVRLLADHANGDRLELRVSGAYAIASHNAALIRRDSIESTIFSIVSLAALFGLLYRRPVRTFTLAFVPTAVGILWGFGVYALLRSTITPLAAVIGGALGGVGIDYPVHLMAHRRADETPFGTTRRMFAPLLAAWATSVIGFAVVAWSPLRLLRDFALIGSLGLAGACAATLLILPALLTLLGDRTAGVTATRGAFATRLWPLIATRPRALVVGSGIVAVVAVIAAACAVPMLRQDTDLTALHPRPNPPLDALEEINHRMGNGGESFVLHLTAGDGATLLRRAWQARRALADCDVVAGVLGPASLLPEPIAAAERIARPPFESIDAVLTDFAAAVADSPFDAKRFDPYRDFLRTLLRPAVAPDLATLRRFPDLAQLVLPSNPVSGGTEAMALVSLKTEPKTPEAIHAVVAALRSRLSGVDGLTLTGMAVLADDARAAVRRDTPRVAITAVLAVTLFLLIHLRSFTLAGLTVVPTIVSFACVVLTMWACGLGLNLVNLVLFPLLLGMNTDYGIFGTDVLRPAVRDRAGERFLAASSALLTCAATAVLGFGSLATVSVPAVRSLGLLISVGLIACVAGALALLWPAVLLIARKRGKL